MLKKAQKWYSLRQTSISLDLLGSSPNLGITPAQAGPPKAPKLLSSSSMGCARCSSHHLFPAVQVVTGATSSHIVTVFTAAFILQGPFSVSIAKIDEHPGPPVSLNRKKQMNVARL